MKQFSTRVVVSVYTDVLLCKVSEVQEFIEWMLGKPVWTHQLPQASRDLAPILERQFPWLKEIDSTGIGYSNWKPWIEKIEIRGETLTVTPAHYICPDDPANTESFKAH